MLRLICGIKGDKSSVCIIYILYQLRHNPYEGFILKDIMSNKSISYKIKK